MVDQLFPSLRLSTHERALYVHLLRHSRLEGRRTVRVSRTQLAIWTGLCVKTARSYLRLLARKHCVRYVERTGRGSLIEVLLPSEVALELAESPASKELVYAAREVKRDLCGQPRAWPRTDEYRSKHFRQRILRRDGALCFYCRRPLRPGEWTLDHVTPVSRGGDSSFSNLVAACFSCNSQKGQLPAPDFLRILRRKRILTAPQLHSRLRWLHDL